MDLKVLAAVDKIRAVLKVNEYEPSITGLNVFDQMARDGGDYTLGSVYSSLNRLIVKGYIQIKGSSFIRTDKHVTDGIL